MKYKYIFFDWGYTLISKFENVDDKINNIKRQALRQLLNPHFVHVNHGAEGRADNEAEQVYRHKAFA